MSLSPTQMLVFLLESPLTAQPTSYISDFTKRHEQKPEAGPLGYDIDTETFRATATTLLGRVPAPKCKEIKAKSLVGAGRTDVCGVDKGTGLPAPHSGLLRYPPHPPPPRPLSCSRGLPSPKTRPRRPCSRIRSSISSQTASQIRAEPAGGSSPPGALGAPVPGPRAQIPFLREGTDLQAGGGGRSGLTGADSPSLQPGRPPHAPELGRPADPSSDSNSAAVGGRRHSQSECVEAARRRADNRKWKPERAGRAAARAEWAWPGVAGRGRPSIRYPEGCQATRISVRAWDHSPESSFCILASQW